MINGIGWNLNEIIALTFYKKLTYDAIRKIVERNDSYYTFTQSQFYANLAEQTDLFNSGASDVLALAEAQIESAQNNNSSIITYWDESYPGILKEIPAPPPVLYIKGKIENPDENRIAIVGTRKCTQYGRSATEHFTEVFCKYGITIVSGLAYGIDTVAHNAAVKTGGKTYAVIASGLDEIGPAYSQTLAEQIVESGGVIVSEYKFGVKALPAYFPQRNRIISGMSKATLVIESADRGGSLITAQFALDQDREVYALPGGIFSNKSVGCNTLIKTGANIALSPQSVLEELNMIELSLGLKSDREKENKFSPEEKKIVSLIAQAPIHIDDISSGTGLSISETLVKLLELEFKSIIKQLPGKYYIKA